MMLSVDRFDTVSLTPNGPIVNPKTGTKFNEEIKCSGILYRGTDIEGERGAVFVKTIDYGNNTPLKKMGVDTVVITKNLSGRGHGSGKVDFVKDNRLLESFSIGDSKAMREFIKTLKGKIKP